MHCDGFEKYALGEWTHEQFARHAAACAECAHQRKIDDELLTLARSLKSPIDAPFLWHKIEKQLAIPTFSIQKSDHYSRWLFRIAAVVVMTIGIGFIAHNYFQKQDSGLLAKSALKKVESQEKEYEAAIARLESVVTPQLSQLDQELMLLYRDRLETIDAQIEQCKEALTMNPANAHIRRYLLAALRDKKATLKEILAYQIS